MTQAYLYKLYYPPTASVVGPGTTVLRHARPPGLRGAQRVPGARCETYPVVGGHNDAEPGQVLAQ